jgi:hypothetical protein
MENFVSKCIWLENGIRCGLARATHQVPLCAINAETMTDDQRDKLQGKSSLGSKNILPVGTLIADCGIALSSKSHSWTEIGRCDPRSN